jgi:hypothetical protein
MSGIRAIKSLVFFGTNHEQALSTSTESPLRSVHTHKLESSFNLNFEFMRLYAKDQILDGERFALSHPCTLGAAI